METPTIDCHCHSDCSPDSRTPVDRQVAAAEARGLRVLCITDHCDFHVAGYTQSIDRARAEGFNVQDPRQSIPRSVRATRACAEQHPNLRLLAGVELGQATQDKQAASRMLSRCDYDFVLGSLHNLAREADFYYMTYTPENAPEILRRYFDELLETAEQNLFDALAHLTYPLRYIVGDAGVPVDLSPYASVIDEILRTVIRNGKAIEVNTSGLRQSIGVPLPDRDLLCRYRALGGELVTVGSDAHAPKDVGAGVQEVYALLRQCGFRQVAYYERRVPHLLEL